MSQALTWSQVRRSKLARKIGVILLVKLMMLILMKNFFFSSDHRVPVDPSVMERRLLSMSPVSEFSILKDAQA